MRTIEWVPNTMPESSDYGAKIMALSEMEKVRAFHKTVPGYNPTPLARLANMAEFLGLADVFVKDESWRMDLNSFKVLGGTFAMGRYIAGRIGVDIGELDFQDLTTEEFRDKFGQTTFFTATDGNHGRSVAWTANRMKQKAVIYMPEGTRDSRLNNILKLGAEATIEDMNYDDCVRLAAKRARECENGVLVQDTAVDGVTDVPSWIMQGYGEMAFEADDQLHEYGVERPTHVFVQAGVGAMAGSTTGFFANRYPDNPPKVCVVECHAADCMFQGAKAGDGEMRLVNVTEPSIMAGLSCGEPYDAGWDILRNHADVFVSVPDWVTARGMRRLAAPLKGDPQVISGESGAVTFGLLFEIMTNPDCAQIKEALGLDETSRVVLFSTEGDTDPERWRDVVWNGNDYRE